MSRVRFTRSFPVQDEFLGTPRETRYALGQVTNLPQSSAAYYVAVGAAVYVDEIQPEDAVPREIEHRTGPGARVSRRNSARPRTRS